METLLDIKIALNKAPDGLLDSLSFGCGENCDEIISIVAGEGSEDYDFPQVFELVNKKYPELEEFNKLVQSVAKAQGILDAQNESSENLSEQLNEGTGITSDFFDEKTSK